MYSVTNEIKCKIIDVIKVYTLAGDKKPFSQYNLFIQVFHLT